MISYNYCDFARKMYDEIYSSISHDEWTLLLNTSKGKSFSDLQTDNKISYKDVYDFLRATPKQRETRKSWKSSTAKLAVLKFLSLRFLKSAYLLLSTAGRLPEHGGYRQVVTDWAMTGDYIRRKDFQQYSVIDDAEYNPDKSVKVV